MSTYGDQAAAVTVQSIGGGGGNGAFNVTGALSLSSEASGTVAVGVGGFGGAGGKAGSVTSTLEGDSRLKARVRPASWSRASAEAAATGLQRHGRHQRLGRGWRLLGLGIGGFGSDGGDGGVVVSNSTGVITTAGS